MGLRRCFRLWIRSPFIEFIVEKSSIAVQTIALVRSIASSRGFIFWPLKFGEFFFQESQVLRSNNHIHAENKGNPFVVTTEVETVIHDRGNWSDLLFFAGSARYMTLQPKALVFLNVGDDTPSSALWVLKPVLVCVASFYSLKTCWTAKAQYLGGSLIHEIFYGLHLELHPALARLLHSKLECIQTSDIFQTHSSWFMLALERLFLPPWECINLTVRSVRHSDILLSSLSWRRAHFMEESRISRVSALYTVGLLKT